MAVAANPTDEECCTVLSFDGTNAFSSIYRHRILPALAATIPLVERYASNEYDRDPPKLLCAMEDGAMAVIR